MLFMVIEHFKDGPGEIGTRFKQRGRLQPEGLVYHASWIDSAGSRCFQLMEAADSELFKAWTSHWDDLMDFEIVPVLTSKEFWAKMAL